MNEPVTLPPYKQEDYPLTERILGLYDQATDWMAEASYSHRELFRFACQYSEDKLKLVQKIAQLRAELDEYNRQIADEKAKIQEIRQQKAEEEAKIQELKRQIVIIKSLKQGPGGG